MERNLKQNISCLQLTGLICTLKTKRILGTVKLVACMVMDYLLMSPWQ